MELVVGRVVKSHGLRGELVVDVRTDDPVTRFAPGSVLHVRSSRSGTPQSREVRVESARPHGTRLLVRLQGIVDRDAADDLRGTLFVVDSADLPPITDPDEFYDHQLEGLAVRTVSGQEVGSISEVLHTSAGELLSVHTPAGSEVLVPFVQAIVTSVSLTDRVVEIDPPEGLLDLES